MVFESIVADLLNRFLGDYIENLDRSQLKIGIWGGDVSLKKLQLKQSALDELNLPVKTVYGHIGTLVLKIPWKNIYTNPVEVRIEEIFLLANALAEVRYDEEKEAKLAELTKQELIQKLEQAKAKAESEKEENAKAKSEEKDSFTEKLAAQIIRNLQLFIGSIHIRYEDRISRPDRSPIALGLTLHSLKLVTTNNQSSNSGLFHKVMSLDGFSLYWNPSRARSNIKHDFSEQSYSDKLDTSSDEIDQLFLKGIASSSDNSVDNLPNGYQYMLGPIKADANLQVNLKPESLRYEKPKFELSFIMQQLFVTLNQTQYQDLISLLDTFDRMSRASLYRKYKSRFLLGSGQKQLLENPSDYIRQRWVFAITCVLEEDVRRQNRNWSWLNMLSHRQLCKKYCSLYKQKLRISVVDQQLNKELIEHEQKLDAFNIILLRQIAENEVRREGAKLAPQPKSTGGISSWVSGWFSKTPAKTDQSQNDANSGGSLVDDLAKKFEEAMTDEEKEKLYKAIDYYERGEQIFPIDFVAMRLKFVLSVVQLLLLQDDTKQSSSAKAHVILDTQFNIAAVLVEQRPAANGLSVKTTVKSVQMCGLEQKASSPHLIESNQEEEEDKIDSDEKTQFLSLLFETNTTDGYDQRLHLELKPLKMVYDAKTVDSILNGFKPAPENDITNIKNQLQAAANSKLDEMKEKSAVSLQYAIEKSSRLDLKVDFMAPYLILPYAGYYTKESPSLVVNLGRIYITSKDRVLSRLDEDDSDENDTTLEEREKQLKDQCYDQFSICLTEVQVLSLSSGERWLPGGRKLNIKADAHLLRPTSIYVDLYKCILNEDDAQMPKIKVFAELPELRISVTEKKLLDTLTLLFSIPLPNDQKLNDLFIAEDESDHEEEVVKLKTSKGSTFGSASSLRQTLQSFQPMKTKKTTRSSRAKAIKSQQSEEEMKPAVEVVNLEATFRMKELNVSIIADEQENKNEVLCLLEASANVLEVTVIQRTYSNQVDAKLERFTVAQSYQDSVVPTVCTPLTKHGSSNYLFHIKLVLADRNSPLFTNVYNRTCVLLEAHFTKLYAVAHREAILQTLDWMNAMHVRVNEIISSSKVADPDSRGLPPAVRHNRRHKDSLSSTGTSSSTGMPTKGALPKVSMLTAILEEEADTSITQTGIIELKVNLNLEEIQLNLESSGNCLASAQLDGLKTSMFMDGSQTVFHSALNSISVCDPHPSTDYNRVVQIMNREEALTVEFTIYNHSKETEQAERKITNKSKHHHRSSPSDMHTTLDEKFDMSVKVRLSCLRCVLIYRFVNDVMAFVDEFETSKRVVAEAGAAAMATATTNVQQAYKSAAKIAFDIHAQAPIIVVPVSSKSDHVFIFDFGQLTVTNSIEPRASIEYPLIDNVVVLLTQMKIYRKRLQNDKSAEDSVHDDSIIGIDKSEGVRLILDPITYELKISRILAAPVDAALGSDIADLDIRGIFYPINARISERDYKLMLDCLNDNLGSGSRECKPSTAVTNVPSGQLLVSASDDDDVKQEETLAECYEDEVERREEVLCKTVLKFQMDLQSITMDLFRNSDEDEEEGLAKFQLLLLSVNGKMMSDGKMSFDAVLENCLLDDTRVEKSKNSVRQYVYGKPVDDQALTSDSAESSIIQMSYVQDAQNNSEVNVKVCSFVVIINIDHLLQLAEFFTAPSNNQERAEVKQRTRDHTNKKVDKPKTEVKQQVKQKPSKESYMTLNLKIEKPDIILVEKMDDLNADCIVLNEEIQLRVMIPLAGIETGDVYVGGVLSDLQIYSSVFDPNKRMHARSIILHPVTLKISGHSSKEANLNLNLSVTPFSLCIKAATVELLSKIASTINERQQPVSNSVHESSIQLNDYSDLWQQKPMELDDHWFLEVEEAVDALDLLSRQEYVKPESDETLAVNSDEEYTEIERETVFLMVEVTRIQVSVDAGYGNRTLPMLSLQSSFYGTTKYFQKIAQTIVEGSLTLEMVYFNYRLGLWQSILEPVPVPSEVYQPKFTPFTLNLSVNIRSPTEASGTNNAHSNVNTSGTTVVRVSSEDRMEVTVSKTCLEVLNRLQMSFNDAIYSKSSAASIDSEDLNGTIECNDGKNMINEQTDKKIRRLIRKRGKGGAGGCYVIFNRLGNDILVSLSDSPHFQVIERSVLSPAGANMKKDLHSNEDTNLLIKEGDCAIFSLNEEAIAVQEFNATNEESILLHKMNNLNRSNLLLYIRVLWDEEQSDLIGVPVTKTDKRYFNVNWSKNQISGRSTNGIGLISQVDLVDGCVMTDFSSVVRVYNHFTVDILIYYYTSELNLEIAGKVGGKRHLNLPLQILVSGGSRLYFAPEKYKVDEDSPFVWLDLQKTVSSWSLQQCYPKDKYRAENQDPFFMKVVGEMESVYFERSERYTMASSCYNIHLKPTMIFKNLLPVDVTVCMQGVASEYIMKPGQQISLHQAEPDFSTIELRIDKYLDRVWSCRKLLSSQLSEFSVWTFNSFELSRQLKKSSKENMLSINLGVFHSNTSSDSSMLLSLYAPFWMVNKTGLHLAYKNGEDDDSVVYHPNDYNEPIMFSFKEKWFLSKKKASVRANKSEWSDKFAIDAAGSSGSVVCHTHKQPKIYYQLGIYIKLNSNSPTKQVIFSPFYAFSNNCPYDLLIHMNNGRGNEASIVKAESGKCIGLWPSVLKDSDKTLRLQICGTDQLTASCSYHNVSSNSAGRTLLTLTNSYGGIEVQVQVSEGGVHVIACAYEPGMAAALIVNCTPFKIKLADMDSASGSTSEAALCSCLEGSDMFVDSKYQLLFNWSNAVAEDPKLLLRPVRDELLAISVVDLRADGIGKLHTDVNSDNTTFYWLSFLDGAQRVLLLSDDWSMASEIQAIGHLQQMKNQYYVCLDGVGFSLVNNLVKRELLYASLTSSGIIWEIEKKSGGRRYKRAAKTFSSLLEKHYQKFILNRQQHKTRDPGSSRNSNADANAVHLNYIDEKDQAIIAIVDFEQGWVQERTASTERTRLTSAAGKLKRIRRRYEYGVWARFCSSDLYNQIHVKVHRLQIDNQMYDCLFPVLFAPVPPPKSMALPAANASTDSGKETGTEDQIEDGVNNVGLTEKPFIELSILQRMSTEYSGNLRQFKYFQVLVQEFHVKMDIGFLNAIVAFMQQETEQSDIIEEEKMALFEKDLEQITEPLYVHLSSVTSQDFYDMLHISPFKIHVSFSLSGSNNPASSSDSADGANGGGGGMPPILNFLTQSVGVTLTDFNDIIFKLAYFERKHKFYSAGELMSEVQSHYLGQLLKQCYVLIFGLDVLGNPFGLVTGLKQGVEDFFYEPFQGAIQGPSEFAEGVVLGVRSLFGHTVGGAADAVQRITGVMGKGIAALTLDEDYQRRRRVRLAQQQNNSIAEHGRSFITGVVEGVGGVVSKPIEGAQQEGVEGFVKGVGKGVVGLFTRPISGVVDLASGTVGTIRRVAISGGQISRIRLPRYIDQVNGFLYPYLAEQAFGQKLLLEADKGKYIKTDKYVVHVYTESAASQNNKKIVLLTDNRVLYLTVNFHADSSNSGVSIYLLDYSVKVEWQYTWAEIQSSSINVMDGGISKVNEGVMIRLKAATGQPTRSSFSSIFKKSSTGKGQTIPISDNNLKQWLTEKMKKLCCSSSAMNANAT